MNVHELIAYGFARRVFIMAVFLSFNTANAQLSDSTIRILKSGRFHQDTSYIYLLPYGQGKKFRLVQGWQSSLSHRGELSQDFKMPVGTPIHASREGIVLRTKEDGFKAGLKDSFLNEGNYILILHNDGSKAGYWHLKNNGAAVEVGDTVSNGQLIGYSGHTGYSAFPHLHFVVF